MDISKETEQRNLLLAFLWGKEWCGYHLLTSNLLAGSHVSGVPLAPTLCGPGCA